MRKAKALREAAEILDDEVNNQSSFDFQDARACFDDVKKIVDELDQMLVEDEENDEEQDDDE